MIRKLKCLKIDAPYYTSTAVTTLSKVNTLRVLSMQSAVFCSYSCVTIFIILLLNSFHAPHPKGAEKKILNLWEEGGGRQYL